MNGRMISFTFIFSLFIAFMVFQRIYEAVVRRKDVEKGDVKSGWTFTALLITHTVLVIATLFEYFISVSKINYFISIAGFLMYVSGLIGRNISLKTLGKFHSLQIEIRKNHSLIREGPYSYMRNPYYFSIIFEIAGFPLIANAYYTLCLAIITYIPLVIIRANIEEREMLKKFGSDYINYKNEVWGFLPIRKHK